MSEGRAVGKNRDMHVMFLNGDALDLPNAFTLSLSPKRLQDLGESQGLTNSSDQ